MNIHKNARLTPCRREEMALSVIEGRLSQAQAGRVFGVSPKIVSRWVERFKVEGRAGVSDRSSRPRRSPKAIEQAVVDRITGDRTGQSNSRGVGWEFVHVAIDDASRVAFSQILPDEKKQSAIAFLKAAVAYYQSLGVTVTQVMTDNGACYISKAFARACRELGLKHIRTRPYTPRTNGKAERFIQTALREWAYALAYPSSRHRADELPVWLHRYNWHRPHASLKAKTPISRLGLPRDNLMRLHS